MTDENARPDPSTRRRSLRRRWNRWFAALAMVSVAAGLVSVSLVSSLVDRLHETSRKTAREAGVLGALGPALSEEHGLPTGSPTTRSSLPIPSSPRTDAL